jgi:predicted nucleotidyltransferase
MTQIISLETIKAQLLHASGPDMGIVFAYLMGSAGTERFGAESDIDIAVYWKKSPSLEELAPIRTQLEAYFNREVDLVSLNGVDLIFSRQVLETGRLFICESAGLHLQWRADQLSRYPDFKFSRKIIESNILNRKKYV